MNGTLVKKKKKMREKCASPPLFHYRLLILSFSIHFLCAATPLFHLPRLQRDGRGQLRQGHPGRLSASFLSEGGAKRD